MNFNWIKPLLANPKTTATGALALAVTAGKCYMMATGKAPIDPDTISTALGMFSTGIGLIIAKDGNGAKVADTVAAVSSTASNLAPIASTIQQTIQSEGDKARDQRIADLTAQIQSVLPQG